MSKPKKSTAAKAESAPKKKWKVWGSTLVHVVKIVEADTAEDAILALDAAVFVDDVTVRPVTEAGLVEVKVTGIHWRTTERGYLVGEFRDALDAPCSIASWGPEGVALGYVDDDVSMGLSRDQARLLGSLLTAFADTGGLREAVDLVALGVKKGAE